MSSRSPGDLLKRLTQEDLTTLTIKIMRKNVTNVSTNTKLSREIGDPRLLVKSVHHREDEGLRPIFDRDDIVVNKDHGPEERVVRHKEEVHHHPKDSKRKFISRTSKLSPPVSTSASRNEQPGTSRRSSRSPSHRQWDYNKSRYNRGGGATKGDDKSRSRSPPYKGSPRVKRERSTSPNGRGGRRSRTPPSRRDDKHHNRGRYGSPSPHKYKDPPEKRKSSRSPHSRALSKSRSPPYRSRRSRTPDRRHSPQRRYERKRSRSRGRREHTPERRRRSSPHRDQVPVRVPEYHPTFYEGDEYWIQSALPPRFLPRGFIPGAFPRGMPAPILMHPRMASVLLPPTGPPFVPPIGPPVRPVRLPIYNSKNLRPRAPAVQQQQQQQQPPTTSSSGATVTSSSNAIQVAPSSSNDGNRDAASEGQGDETSLVSPKAEDAK